MKKQNSLATGLTLLFAVLLNAWCSPGASAEQV